MPATCQNLLTWLRLRHKGSALHQLCDEALLALQAEAHLMELWARGDAMARRAAEQVLPLVLARFPPDRAVLAQEAIAHSLDWPDIPRLWPWSQPGADGGGPPELLPPPQGQPTARCTGPRSPLCSTQCRRATKYHQVLGHSLAGFTGQDHAAHAALAHMAAQLACTPEEATWAKDVVAAESAALSIMGEACKGAGPEASPHSSFLVADASVAVANFSTES